MKGALCVSIHALRIHETSESRNLGLILAVLGQIANDREIEAFLDSFILFCIYFKGRNNECVHMYCTLT